MNFNATESGSPFAGSPPGEGALPLDGASLQPGLLMAAIFGIILVGVALVVVSAMAKGALIGLVRRIDSGEASSVRAGFSDGFRNFLAIIGISLSIWIPAFIVGFLALLAFSIPAFVAFAGGLGRENPPPTLILAVLLGVLVFVAVALPVAAVLSIINTFAESYRVVEGSGVFTSISKGFRLLRERKGASAAFFFIVLGLSIAFAIAAGFIGLVTMVPAASAFSKAPFLGVSLAIPGLAILILASSIFQAFISSTWTLAFLSLSGLGSGAADRGTEGEP